MSHINHPSMLNVYQTGSGRGGGEVLSGPYAPGMAHPSLHGRIHGVSRKDLPIDSTSPK
ncbi:hypothetical protein J122_3371 [Marinobacter excellens LAMA 842]|uniref:Uncharacterized protein n=1 Tax=Marinobacter excellens LAMA 842 TaxID=1306954 RepID=A0A137S4W2_9GAMM|nr:hypothetical protein J122_3371 [Marinobacter excellens LAMA 842]